MACPICQKRKPKRFCPAKGAKICSICCGTEREVTIDCPFECPYLQESRERESKGNLDPKDFPYKEIRIDQDFLREHGEPLVAVGLGTFQAALESQGAVDSDVQEALKSLIETYRTLESGIHYENRPESLVARGIYNNLRERIVEFQQQETRESGFTRTRDSDIRAILVFLYRVALDRDNHRPRGKAFLHFLRSQFREAEQSEPSLIVPGM